MRVYYHIACLDVFERTVKCRLTQAFITCISSQNFARFVIRRNSTQAFFNATRVFLSTNLFWVWR